MASVKRSVETGVEVVDGRQTAQADESQLVARAKAGDAEAFGELYRDHFESIYRYVRTRVATETDTEDITEAVFLKAFEALPNYVDHGRPFGAYLYTIARNAVVDHYRQQKDETEFVEAVQAAGPGRAIERGLEHRQSVAAIEAAMKQLPSHYQEVIRLRVLLGLSSAEVGEWMEREPSNVRVLQHRALIALKQLMGVGDDAS